MVTKPTQENPLRAIPCLLLLLGCATSGSLDTPAGTTAHRASAGYWPGNSHAAVVGTLAAGFEAMEIDLVLSKDGVPVLAHDPVLDAEHCTTARGKELEEQVRIADTRWAALQENFLCGGTADPDHPRAEVVAEPLMSLDEVLVLLQDADPQLGIHLDIKQEPGWTAEPADFADEVLKRWWQADLPQPMWVSAGRTDVLMAFEDKARERGKDLHTVLIFPLGDYGDSQGAVALGAERDSLLGKNSYVDLIETSGSDGIYVHWEVARRAELLHVRRAGYETGLWTVNDPATRLAMDDWPVDTWITDYPAGL